MISALFVGFIAGVLLSKMVRAFFEREAAVAKITILAEMERVTPDVKKIKALLAKL